MGTTEPPEAEGDVGRLALVREVAALAWPVVAQGLFVTVVLFTDRVILGRWHADALAAMQACGPVLWSVLTTAGVFTVGTMAVVGRAAGAGDVRRAAETARAVYRLAIAVGIALAAVGWLGRHAIVGALSGEATSDAVREMSVTYLGLVILFSPIKLVGNAARVVLQAHGDTATPARIAVVAGVVNVAVSWALVYGQLGLPELGVLGAAIGTAIAFVLDSTLCWIGARARVRGVAAPGGGGAGSRAALRPVLRISTPALGEKVIYHSAYLVFVGMVGHLGDAAMAAHQAAIAIESLGFIAAEGFSVAAAAIVARMLGAGRVETARACGWIALGLSVTVLSGAGLVFFFAAEPLMRAFTDDPEVIALGVRCLQVAAFAQPLMAAADAFAGALRGAGDTTTPMRAAIAGPLVVRLTACYVLAYSLGWGLVGIWIGSTLDWLVRAVWMGVAFARGRWKAVEI